MNSYQPAMAGQFRSLLEARAERLRDILRHEADAVTPDGGHEVQDFKDIASGDLAAAVDDAQAAHAAQELEQLGAALRRIAEGSYGQCVDCGDAIDLRRLTAMPSTAVCTPCQAVREQHAGGH